MAPETKPPCRHPKLTFASGGWFVICTDCGAYWQSQNGPKDSKGHEGLLYGQDFRSENC